MLGSQRFHCHDKTDSGVVDSSEVVAGAERTNVKYDRQVSSGNTVCI